MSELSKSWPIIGIAILMWVGVIVLRTPALGINAPRVISILVSSTAMLTLGIYIERIRRELEQRKKDNK